MVTQSLIPFTKFDIGIDKTIDIDFFGSIDIGIDQTWGNSRIPPIQFRPIQLIGVIRVRAIQ